VNELIRSAGGKREKVSRRKYLLHSAHDKAALRRLCFEDGELGLGSWGGMKEEAMGDEE
jgi:hypothetical protein